MEVSHDGSCYIIKVKTKEELEYLNKAIHRYEQHKESNRKYRLNHKKQEEESLPPRLSNKCPNPIGRPKNPVLRLVTV